MLPLADSPAAEAIRRRGRRRQRTVRVAVLVPVVLLGVAVTRGAELLTAESTLGPASPAPTTQASPPTTTPPVTPPVASPTTRERAPTTAPPTTGAGVSRTPVLRPDGLGVTAFGAAELDALAALKRRLGPPDERGSWNGASPFGTGPGSGSPLGPAVRPLHQRADPVRGPRTLASVRLPGGRHPAHRGRPQLQRPRTAA